MFPTYDMNPIAIEHMQREKLRADIAFVDQHAELIRSEGGKWWPQVILWLRQLAMRGRQVPDFGFH